MRKNDRAERDSHDKFSGRILSLGNEQNRYPQRVYSAEHFLGGFAGALFRGAGGTAFAHGGSCVYPGTCAVSVYGFPEQEKGALC